MEGKVKPSLLYHEKTKKIECILDLGEGEREERMMKLLKQGLENAGFTLEIEKK